MEPPPRNFKRRGSPKALFNSVHISPLPTVPHHGEVWEYGRRPRLGSLSSDWSLHFKGVWWFQNLVCGTPHVLQPLLFSSLFAFVPRAVGCCQQRWDLPVSNRRGAHPHGPIQKMHGRELLRSCGGHQGVPASPQEIQGEAGERVQPGR